MIKDWEEPRLFDAFDLPAFPIECLPSTMRRYVGTISKNLATPIEMAVLVSLSLISVSTQGRVTINVKKDYNESTNLYVLIIAEPGERKSPLLKLMSKPIYEYERNINEQIKIQINRERAELKRKQKELMDLEEQGDIEEAIKKQNEIDQMEKNKSHLVRLTSDDFTVEALTTLMAENNGKMSIISSEGGMFNNISGRYNNKVSFEVLLKAFSGDTIRVDRKSRGPEIIDNALLTILLMAQESVLEGIMENGDLRGQGLLGRFLYCVPKSPLGNRKYETPQLNKDIIETFNNKLFELLNCRDNVLLTLSDEAYEISKDFFNWIEPKLVGELYEIRDWASKLHGTFIRLAGLLHCIEYGSNSTIINKQTMDNARKISMYFVEHSKKAFSIMGTNEVVIKAKYILKKLESLHITEISKKDIYIHCRSRYFKSPDDIIKPIELLIDYNYLRAKENQPTNSTGRKPSTVYELNPIWFLTKIWKEVKSNAC